MSGTRVDLVDRAAVGYEMVYQVDLKDFDAAVLNLTGYTIAATAYKPTAHTTTVTPTCTNLAITGRFQVLFSAAQMDTAGEWWLNIFATASGGNARPIQPWKYRFYADAVNA